MACHLSVLTRHCWTSDTLQPTMRSLSALLLLVCLAISLALVVADPPVPSSSNGNTNNGGADANSAHGRFHIVPPNLRADQNHGKPSSGEDVGSELAPVNPSGVPRSAGIVNDASQVRITNHGGGVMTATTIQLYYIFYGQWTGANVSPETRGVPAVLERFGTDIKNSPWLSIVKQGYGASAAAGWVAGNSVYIPRSDTYGNTSMSDANIQQLVMDVMNLNKLPTSVNAIYLVITSPEVTANSGFCTAYCGWHTAVNFKKTGTTTTSTIKYGQCACQHTSHVRLCTLQRCIQLTQIAMFCCSLCGIHDSVHRFGAPLHERLLCHWRCSQFSKQQSKC
jgi:hypothetical protein